MLKIFLFAILVVFQGLASAASIISHEKFVHLSYPEQRRIIIATMKLVVELESKYQHEVKTSGYSEERFRKFSSLIRGVVSVLIPEAHAAPDIAFGTALADLRRLVNDRDRCLYAGWVSDMNPTSRKCNHPANAWNQQIRSRYRSTAGCGTGRADRSRISCNPAIFGYKDVARGTLFCVDAGEGADANGVAKSENSSKQCMQKALGLSDPPEQDASPTETRLQDIADRLAETPEAANAVFDFLIRACACDARVSPQISTHYSNYMRPHQTCYSILRMLSEVAPRCQIDGQPLADANQRTFLQSINGLLSREEVTAANIRSTYQSKIAPLVSGADIREICGPDGVPDGGGITVDNTDTTPNPDPTPDPTPDPDSNDEEIVVTGTRCRAPDVLLTVNEGAENETSSCCRAATHVVVGEGTARQCLEKCPNNATRNSEAPFACPEAAATADVALNLTSEDKTTTVKVTATITPEGTPADQYKVLWFRQGQNFPSTFTFGNASAATTPTVTVTPNQDPEETETPSEPNPTSDDPGENQTLLNLAEGAMSVDAPKTTVEYQVCARLIKKSDNSRVGAEQCKPIAKLATPAAPAGPRPASGPFNPFQQQPMMPTRGGPSDAIFRGVR